MRKLNIIVVEPFYADSHKEWLDNLIFHSSHHIEKLVLPGRHWKWRMHGAAVTLAEEYKKLNTPPDLILCTDMLDLGTFAALIKNEIQGIPIAVYFHENQITYPWNASDKDLNLKRDRHYGFINYTSALVADKVLFNSLYHKESFLNALNPFLKAYPDYKNLTTIEIIKKKSKVLYLGMHTKNLFEKSANKINNRDPIILWNHRWEYDKNPELFFKTLIRLQKEGIKFKLIVAGKKYKNYPKVFDEAKELMKEEIIHWGYAERTEEYMEMLQKSDFLPVTSNQDFFGISVVEAMAGGVLPILPNRLAYPEHVQESKYIYVNAESLYLKLRNFILNFHDLKKPSFPAVLQYDWGEIIQEYDTCFIEISNNQPA